MLDGGTLQVTAAIAARAADADHTDGDLAPDVALLQAQGWLRACLPQVEGGEGWGTEPTGVEPAFEALRALGRANLSVARLFEGHMNAVKLVMLYGSPAMRREIALAIGKGLLLGVWGADDLAAPLSFARRGAHLRLGGAKRFASGLGLVGRAVVTAASDEGARMLLVPTTEAQRCDQQVWRMAGMRATRSGRYDFEGVELPAASLLGEPGDYLREPHFEGGIWRYCAAHLGGAEALYEAMREALVARERADDPHQQRRIVEAASAIETARLWLVRAASEVEADGAQPAKATLSLLAREITEASCRTVIETVERALGMAAHEEGTGVERMRRELALFLCQAAPDAKRARAARALVDHGGRVEDL